MSDRQQPFDPQLTAAAAAGFQEWRRALQWQRAVEAALSPHQLTHTQFVVLHSLAVAEGRARDAVFQRAIAQEAGLGENTVSAVMRTLESRHLVDRAPAHGIRAWRVILTKSGERLLEDALPLIEAVAARLAPGVSGCRD